jgi:hypothetical protein
VPKKKKKEREAKESTQAQRSYIEATGAQTSGEGLRLESGERRRE